MSERVLGGTIERNEASVWGRRTESMRRVERTTKRRKAMAEQARVVSVEPQKRHTLPEASWEDINQPGAYVEVGTGDLYRIPKEALIPGSSPVIRKESSGASRLVQLSPNPFITTLQARMLACEHNVEPNF
jgi:hypothetical protein